MVFLLSKSCRRCLGLLGEVSSRHRALRYGAQQDKGLKVIGEAVGASALSERHRGTRAGVRVLVTTWT